MSLSDADIARMRGQLFFEGDGAAHKLSRYWLLLLLAAVIASAGVVADSTATVIGAMIVAPLMVPILGTLLGVVLADRDNLIRCVVLVVAGSAAVVGVGYLLGVLVEPIVAASTNGQVAGRVSPRLVDLIAALATGAVGSVALAREDISDTLPGVAISISLVPPLAVVGLTLESGAPEEAFGALLLFLTNVSAILGSGLAVMAAYRVHRLVEPRPEGSVRTLRRGRATAAIIVSLVVISIPLGLTSARVTADRNTEATVDQVVGSWAEAAGWDLVGITTTSEGVSVRVTGQLPEPEVGDLRAELDTAGLAGTEVELELIPVTRLTL
nr:DUF389 domain-containing protein [Rhabdothermincola salaria]